MNLLINPGAATDDAQQIDAIVSQIAENMQTLNSAITGNIPSTVQTDWSNTLLENWNEYYTADIPQAMETMKLSAQNLRLAVDQALTYSQEG